MSQAPSMPIFWDAYIADTTHLSTEEHGAYLLLLAAMWRRNGWVPDDDRDNARIIGLTPAKWRRAKERLRPLLVFDNGHISQKNLLKIWKNTQEKIEKNRLNGAKGGRPKTKENNDLEKANGFVSGKPNKSIPEPEPEPLNSLSSGDDLRGFKPVDEISEAVNCYNVAAKKSGWPQVKVLSKSRRSALAARLKDCGGLQGWREVLDKAQASPHCCGQNDRGWVINFDFIINQNSFTKLIEGNYDARKPSTPNQSARTMPIEEWKPGAVLSSSAGDPPPPARRNAPGGGAS